MSARDKVKVIGLLSRLRYHPDLDAHPVPPALLACATSAARDATEPFHLPFMYRRMTVYGRLPAVITAVNHRTRAGGGLIIADVSLTDPAGALLVAVTGFTMRQVDPAGFSLALTTPPPASRPGDRLATVADDQGRAAGIGISPDQGIALLLTLLATDTPERVLVRPFADDQPATVALRHRRRGEARLTPTSVGPPPPGGRPRRRQHRPGSHDAHQRGRAGSPSCGAASPRCGGYSG